MVDWSWLKVYSTCQGFNCTGGKVLALVERSSASLARSRKGFRHPNDGSPTSSVLGGWWLCRVLLQYGNGWDRGHKRTNEERALEVLK